MSAITDLLTCNMTSLVPVNDIQHCLVQAHNLSQHIHKPDHRDHSLVQVFISLAEDNTTGLLAFAIWRGRSHFYNTSLLGNGEK